MTSSGIRYELQDAVAVVTLDRPERLNAIDLEMGRAYNEALLRADADPEVRAVVVAGAGRAFCSGADLSAMAGMDSLPAEERLPAHALAPELAMRLRKPVIAAVNGPAIGVGLVLALYADVRIVAHDAALGLLFPRLGLVAEYGTAWLLPRLVGAAHATELLLGGTQISGDDAARIGLAHRAVPATDVLAVASSYAADLALGCAPTALAEIKAQLVAGCAEDLRAALVDSRRRMLECLDSPDLREGFAARVAGRPPAFQPLPTEVS